MMPREAVIWKEKVEKQLPLHCAAGDCWGHLTLQIPGYNIGSVYSAKKKSCWESLQLPRTAPPALPASPAWPTAAAALWSLLHSWEGSSFEFPVPAQLQPVQCHHITPCPGPTCQLTGMEAMQLHQAQSSGLTKPCFQTVHDNSYTLISDYTSWFCSHGLQPWHYQKMRQSGGLVSGPTLCFL